MAFHVSAIYVEKSEYMYSTWYSKSKGFFTWRSVYVQCNIIGRFWLVEQFYCETSLGNFKM